MRNYLLYVLGFIAVAGFHLESAAQVNVLWESRFTSSGLEEDAGKEIAIDASGNVYVTGTSYTDATNGYDIVTIKYDPLRQKRPFSLSTTMNFYRNKSPPAHGGARNNRAQAISGTPEKPARPPAFQIW